MKHRAEITINIVQDEEGQGIKISTDMKVSEGVLPPVRTFAEFVREAISLRLAAIHTAIKFHAAYMEKVEKVEEEEHEGDMPSVCA